MYRRASVIYSYDGSYDGALCCVFEAFLRKERPVGIVPETKLQPTFCTICDIMTDPAKADRVARALAPKISKRAEETVQDLFWTCHPEKELLMLDFIRLGLEVGPKVTTMLGNETVAAVADAVKHLLKEAHNFKGFLRFSVYGAVLVGVIEPKNFVLPVLSPHFCARYRNETFLIWDKTHKVAVVYAKGKSQMIALDELTLPAPDANELQMRALWKQFFETIAIEPRTNALCQMSHLPKRYRGQMTEFISSVRCLPQEVKDETEP